MRQYSIDSVDVAWLGLDIKAGLAAGTSITIASNAQDFTITPTGQGESTRTYDPNDTGTCSIVVDQTAQLHQQLIAISNADRIPATRNKVGTMMITDNTSKEEIKLKNTFITAKPDPVRGTEAVTFTWVFAYEGKEQQAVATLANAVGD